MADQPTTEETRVAIMANVLFDLYQKWLRDGKPERAGQDA